MPHRIIELENRIRLTDGVAEASHNGVLVLNAAREIALRNNRLLEILGLNAAELASGGLYAVQHALTTLSIGPGAQLKFDGEAIRQSGPIRDLLRFKDGRAFERSVNVTIVDGEIVGYVVVFNDVTRLTQAEEALARDRAFLEKAQEVAHVGSWAIELNTPRQELIWSREMYRILGLDTDYITSSSDALTQLVHPDDRERVRTARDSARAAGRPYEVEHRIVRPDGTVRWVQTRAETTHDGAGTPVRVVGTMQDVTARRELEEQLRHAQRIEALGRLAGGVAHELNNALNIILGYSEVALEDSRGNHQIAGDLEEIKRATERAASTVRQLLTFARKPQGSNRVFRLDESLSAVGRMLDRLFGASIALDISADSRLPPTWGDPGQVEQAIVNLAINARDAMPAGGHLALRLTALNLDSSFAERHCGMTPGPHLMLSISDSGHGMPPDVLERVFDPFFTTKAIGHGTGLGLPMVQRTMQEIGGAVVAQSTPGVGTTFVLYFPVAKRLPAEKPVPVVEASPHELSVLVVDDELAVRELVAGTLRRAGYRVLAASSGREAMVVATDHKLDLLVTDLRMPGLNGRELARALTIEQPEVRVIVMTGFADETLDVGGPGAPVVRLDKPFTQAALRAAVQRAVTSLSSSIAD